MAEDRTARPGGQEGPAARLARNVPALTAAECARLGRKRVCVVGCGGLGGYLLELLARLGVGALRAIDGDVFEESNLNRQLYASPDLLGAPKAEAAAARLRRVCPETEVEAVRVFLDETNAAALVAGCDAALDALDNLPARRALKRACDAAGIPYIYGAVSGWTAQAAVSLPGDGLLERLYPAGASAEGEGAPSFTPALGAAMQSALCARLLAGRPVEAGLLYHYDLLRQEFETVRLA